jgi:uncharacterized protein (DUF2141 family)
LSILPSAANRTALALFFALIAFSCAKMGAPPGGPEDKIAPQVVFTSPETDALSVDVQARVVLEFSEMMNRPSVETALYLSPEPGNRLRYHWKGRRLTLEYLDALEINRTHVVSVGAQAKDLQGNALENSFTLAFSTGNHIDRGAFSGLAEIPEGLRSLSILAYSRTDANPMSEIADYRIQTASDGTFELSYLAPATYRVFAVADRNFDGKWSPASEVIGTASSDVMVTEGENPYVTFSPTLQDTTPWTMLRVKSVDRRTMNLRFNHPAQPSFELSDGAGVHFPEHVRPDSSSSGSWFAYFAEELTGDSATVRAQVADTELVSRCAISLLADTTRPELFESFPESYSKLRTIPQQIYAAFSEPVVVTQQDESLSVMMMKDTTLLPVIAEQSDPAAMNILPLDSLMPGSTYTIEIPSALVSDYSGNTPRDSVLLFSWYTYPQDSLGSIVGSVQSVESSQWLVELLKVGENVPLGAVSTQSVFEFVNYPPDDYLLRVIQDRNNDQNFDRGFVEPFGFSEPFLWHPETLTVRPRWQSEATVVWIIK